MYLCNKLIGDTTIYHESFEAEKFCGFCGFLHVCKTFLYESLRWRCSNMDLRESMWDSAKLFYLETFSIIIVYACG